MRKLVLFMHVSLDGFVAGPAGEMDWIKVDEEMFEYAGKQTNEADTALYGRVTYQMMESYWPTAADQPAPTKHDIEHSRWYNQVTKLVASRTMQGKTSPNTKIISDHLSSEIIQLKQTTGKNILMFGSQTVAHLLTQENLIDEYWIFINPILIGKGIPLFQGIKEHVSLKLMTSNVFPSGVVCLHYESIQKS